MSKAARFETLQLLHNGANHWVLVVASGQQLFLYDSGGAAVTDDLAAQMGQIFPAMVQGDGSLPLQRVAVPQQTNGRDCGVYAIAYAFSLLGEANASILTEAGAQFDVRQMRPHLCYCFESLTTIPFPRRPN